MYRYGNDGVPTDMLSFTENFTFDKEKSSKFGLIVLLIILILVLWYSFKKK